MTDDREALVSEILYLRKWNRRLKAFAWASLILLLAFIAPFTALLIEAIDTYGGPAVEREAARRAQEIVRDRDLILIRWRESQKENMELRERLGEKAKSGSK